MDKIKKNFLKHKRKIELSLIFITTLLTPMVTNAAISQEWMVVYNKLEPWVARVALLLVFIGGIDLAVGWSNEDANSKVKGTAKMVAGVCLGIVWATAKSTFDL